MRQPVSGGALVRLASREVAKKEETSRRRGSLRVPNRSGAFTLIEIVTSIAVSGILAGVLAVPLIEGVKARARLFIRNELVFTARTALDRMARDLRGIALSGANPDIATADASRIDYGANIYRLTGTDLQFSANSGTTYRTVASNVASLQFSYQDDAGSALSSVPLDTSNRNSIRRITITLTVSRSANQTMTESLTLRTMVYLRAFSY